NVENGDLLNSTQGITQHQATAAYKLLQNVSLLLGKQQGPNNSKKNASMQKIISNGTGEEKEIEKKQKDDESFDILNRVTVSFQDCNYGFTVSDDKIYGIKRIN
ncbi:15227_t:CDS:2, partial [Funneliformis geosporum]